MPVVINSRFTPLTYDEITRPLIEQTQAQEALENAYIEAQDQAAQLMSLANEQTDHNSYTQLKNYSEALQQQADSLMRQGLNRNSRQSLINMRRRYAQDIIPIQNAAARRQALVEEQRQMQASHPDMLFERNANTISLDDLVRNPQMNYGRTVLGSDITNRVGTAVAAAARGIQSIKMGQNLDKYTQTIIQQAGFTPEQIANAIANKVSDNNILVAIRNGVLASSGVLDWSNQAAIKRATDYANEGFYRGFGETKIGTQRDFEAEENYKYNQQIRLMEEKARIEQEEAERKAKETAASGWVDNPQAILLANGNQGKYNTLVQTLINTNGFGKAEYFGQNGQANPMEVYETYTDARKNMKATWDKKRAAAEQTARAAQDPMRLAEIRKEYSNEAFENEFNNWWELYTQQRFGGLDKVITEEEYDLLKNLGYDAESADIFNAGDMLNKVNALSTQYTVSSTNLSKYGDNINKDFALGLDATKRNDSVKEDIKIYDPTTGKTDEISREGKHLQNIEGKQIVNIQYSQLHPDKLIVTFADDEKGTKPTYYAINPKLFGTTAAEIVNQANAAMSKYDAHGKAQIQAQVTRMLAQYLDTKNKVSTETTSKPNF